jgi:malonyl-CoA/methylmalonyl-CoA synthetase
MAQTPLLRPGTVAGWRRHRVAIASDAEASEVRSALRAGSLVAAADDTARRLPDRIALRIGAEAITHAALADRSRRLAAHLRSAGIRPGGRVLIAGANSIAFVTGYLAALRAGAAVSLVHPTVPAPEVASLLTRIRPGVALVTRALATELAAIDATRPRLRTLDEGPDSIDAAIESSLPLVESAVDADTVAHLAFTSGTTGLPKLVPLTHGNVLASARAIMTAWAWEPDDVLVHALPLQHAHGLSAVHLTLLTGSRSVVLPRFDGAELARAIEAEGATVLFGVPAIYDALLADGTLTRTDTSRLRLVTSGSAALAPAASDALAGVLGVRPLERYGLTESGFVLSNPYEGERIAGAVGYPLPGIEVELVDGDQRPVPDGSDGEIVVRGPQVFAGYDPDPDPAATWTRDGWFRTGDLGRRSELTGSISIVGRLKELIISGGLNVYPREVELAIESLPHVRAAAVVGVPSARWGEEVTAFVEAEPGFDPDAMLAALRARLAPYKCPKRCYVIAALPRNQLGKVLRTQLRDSVNP